MEIESECAHCGEALHITVASDLRCHVREKDAQPLLFEPEIDWDAFQGANIIDDY